MLILNSSTRSVPLFLLLDVRGLENHLCSVYGANEERPRKGVFLDPLASAAPLTPPSPPRLCLFFTPLLLFPFLLCPSLSPSSTLHFLILHLHPSPALASLSSHAGFPSSFSPFPQPPGPPLSLVTVTPILYQLPVQQIDIIWVPMATAL